MSEGRASAAEREAKEMLLDCRSRAESEALVGLLPRRFVLATELDSDAGADLRGEDGYWIEVVVDTSCSGW
jgi:hypothetical protein